MAETLEPSPSLKQVLDGIQLSHRKDIESYSGGHLNESNLRKPPELAGHQAWQSALGPSISLVAKSNPSKSKVRKDNDKMKDTLARFCLGTEGGLGLPPVKDSTNSGRTPPAVLMKERTFIEELKIPDMMLEKMDHPSKEDRGARDKLFDEPVPDDLELHARHEFVPSHHTAITKKDQYRSMKSFERGILRKQDAQEQHVLAGTGAVRHLEIKLAERLDELPFEKNAGANFHRLQVYSSIFDELVASSASFGYMLGIIKREYDDLVSVLLDSQVGRSQALQEHIAQLSARGTSNPEVLHAESQRVEELEEEAERLLAENERLRQGLLEEDSISTATKPESAVHAPVRRDESALEMVDEVERMRHLILHRVDAIEELRTKLQQHYVPVSVCNHLEQCIKETEIEIQKLLSQKQYFERNINDMESELEKALEEADTTQHDIKRVHNKLSAVMGSGMQLDEDEDESNDENKWNWYIS